MIRYFLVFLLIAVYFAPAQAQDIDVSTLSAQAMLQNIAQQLPNLMRFATALSYVLGMYFIFYGLLKLKMYGEARTMMSHQHHLREPMLYLIVGSLLLYFPTTVQVGMSTFWTNPNPYEYLQQTTTGQWSQFITICFSIIQFIGVVAFIRGLVILSHLGGHGGHQGGFGKAITHIIGGIFCINFYQFVQVIFGTLGIQASVIN